MSRKQRRAHLQPESRPKFDTVSPPLSELAQRFGNDAVDTRQGFWDTPPKLTDADASWGVHNWRQYLPPWASLTKDEQQGRGPWCDAVSSLFFNGGKLADHGITVKPDINSADVHRYMKAMLQDWSPPHEHKIGGIAHMLKKWCTYHNKGQSK